MDADEDINRIITTWSSQSQIGFKTGTVGTLIAKVPPTTTAKGTGRSNNPTGKEGNIGPSKDLQPDRNMRKGVTVP